MKLSLPTRLSGNSPNAIPDRLHSLDALRGLASLSVVLWHWVHFFLRDKALFVREQEPLYFLLAPFYLEGWRAVDLFFSLSGFVFYWRYANRVAARRVSMKEFWVLRFARLYPLHALTLVMVAIGQHFMFRYSGAFFVYPNNDAFHFGLQTVLAANWGLERGWSFNAPVWSVSFEIVLYAVFFSACFLNFRRWWHLAAMGFGGVFLMMSEHPHLHQLGSCAFSFFIGGTTFYLFGWVARKSLPGRTLAMITGLLTVMWIFIPLNTRHNLLYNFAGDYVWMHDIALPIREWTGSAVLTLTKYSFELFLFPLTFLTLALWEQKGGAWIGRIGFLGQISYSSYLLHFPLQMAFAGATMVLGIPVLFFRTPLSFFLFFAVLIPLSLASYRWYERPCQLWLTRVLK